MSELVIEEATKESGVIIAVEKNGKALSLGSAAPMH